MPVLQIVCHILQLFCIFGLALPGLGLDLAAIVGDEIKQYIHAYIHVSISTNHYIVVKN